MPPPPKQLGAGRRARRAEDKQQRRAQLLARARELFADQPFAEVKMIDIARAAGVAKGTVFIYFPTKEAVFLELLAVELWAWLDEFDAGLASGRGPWSSARVSRLIVGTLGPRKALQRLLALLSSVLEHNVEVEQIISFKRTLLARLAETGVLLERRLGFLAPGEGARFMLQLNAMVIGVHNMAHPGAAGREALEHPELAPLVVEFEAELGRILDAFLRGLEQDR